MQISTVPRTSNCTSIRKKRASISRIMGRATGENAKGKDDLDDEECTNTNLVIHRKLLG